MNDVLNKWAGGNPGYPAFERVKRGLLRFTSDIRHQVSGKQGKHTGITVKFIVVDLAVGKEPG